jgi:glycosyltransferase involved in cell wall biosynthesis
VRIAILSCFYPYRGGIAQFNSYLFTELSKKYTVKAFNFTKQYPDFLFPGKTQYVSGEDDKAMKIESEAVLDTANPVSYVTAARKIREWNPDLLIMRYWMSYFGPSLGYVARHVNKGCRVISIVDNVIPHEQRFFDKPFTKYFLNGNDGFLVLCDAVKNDLLRFRPDAKYINTPHPLYQQFGAKKDKAEARLSLGIHSDKKTLLFFGLIRKYKGLDILIKAFSQLDSSYQLVIAGEPYDDIASYQALIDESPRKENIFLTPRYIKTDEVSEYFSAADVCVLPYRSATQSGISSISYFYELPMITTNVGGLKSAIGDTGTGIVVDEINEKSIAGAIRKYFGEDRSIYIEAIKKEKERLGWNTFCSKLIEFYKTL